MKKLLSILLLCCLCGCSSTNIIDKQTYEDLKVGIETFDIELQTYWKNDSSLSQRSKNTKETKLNAMKDAFKSLKVK